MSVFALNFYTPEYLFFAFSYLSDEGVPSWRGVDCTAFTLFLVFDFRFSFLWCFSPNKRMYVCIDEKRE